MRMHLPLPRRLVGLMALFVVACSTGVQTSVPAQTPISNLSAEQTQQLCRDRRRYVEGQFSERERKTLGCNLVGILTGSLAAGFGGGADAGVGACRMTFDQCQSAPAMVADGGTSDGCAMLMPLANCAATVTDYNTCLVERYEQLRPWTQSNQCDQLTSAADAGVPPTCTRILPTCMPAQQLSW